MFGESIETKGSSSDLVFIKQLAKKNSHPPQVLSYRELPWPAWQVLSETWGWFTACCFTGDGDVCWLISRALHNCDSRSHCGQGVHLRCTLVSQDGGPSHPKIIIISPRAPLTLKSCLPHPGNSPGGAVVCVGLIVWPFPHFLSFSYPVHCSATHSASIRFSFITACRNSRVPTSKGWQKWELAFMF